MSTRLVTPVGALLKVGYFVGSLAKASINRKLARALMRLAPEQLVLSEIDFGELPLYSYDYDPTTRRPLAPQGPIASVDAVLFVTPEYNRSVPGALKNAIDWASRPSRQNALSAKAVGDHRDVSGEDRHRHRADAPAQHPGVLQLAAP